MSDVFYANCLDRSFPLRLRDIDPVPALVEARGPLARSLDSLGRAVAIVGARAATDRALEFTRFLASSLAKAGVVIVSGGAFGVDVAAHEGALDAGGQTIAVFPGGLDCYSPVAHRRVFEEIAARGAIVAIRPRGTVPHRPYFLQRNAVIAALADHVVVTAAGLKSGARSTAAHARKLNRTLWAVPGPPWETSMVGCIEEIIDGARVLKDVQQLRDAFAIPPSSDVAARPPPGLPASTPPGRRVLTRTAPTTLSSPTERAVHGALHEGSKSIDELVLVTGLEVGSLRSVLLTWTVEGVVRESPAGRFSLVSR